MNGHFDIVRLLIDANADIDLPDKVYRRSAMHDKILC